MKPPNGKKSATSMSSCPCCKTTPHSTNLQQPSSIQQTSTACPPQPRILNKGKRTSTTTLQPPKRAKTAPIRISTDVMHQLDLSDSEEEAQSLPQQPPVRTSDSSSEEPSTELTYDDVIQEHVTNFMPGTHIPFTGSVSTTIVSQIKPSICKDIWRYKFVDLTLLLPNSTPAISTTKLQLTWRTCQLPKHKNPGVSRQLSPGRQLSSGTQPCTPAVFPIKPFNYANTWRLSGTTPLEAQD